LIFFLDMLQEATETVAAAISHDARKEYPLAFEKYKSALDMFILVLKLEKNPNIARAISGRVVDYLERAEIINGLLYPPKEIVKKKPSASTASNDSMQRACSLSSTLLTSRAFSIKWEDVAGLESAKATLKEAVVLPVRFPQLFAGNRRPWKGVLLYGPPGTGKSFLAKAVASESSSRFYSVSSSDLVSKWQGESERLVKQLFTMARETAPAVIFIDEIDSMCGGRGVGDSDSSRRIKTEFLVQMDGVGNDNRGVLVLGATNTPWSLDQAIRRRFQKRIHIPLPDLACRMQMFKIHLGEEFDETEMSLRPLALCTESYSGSDIQNVVHEALMEPLRVCKRATQFIRESGTMTPVRESPNCSSCGDGDGDGPCYGCGAISITLEGIEPSELRVPRLLQSDILAAVQRSSKSVCLSDLAKYTSWTADFGQEGN
jgi:vacuolar protein-sorting-associated protein 4